MTVLRARSPRSPLECCSLPLLVGLLGLGASVGCTNGGSEGPSLSGGTEGSGGAETDPSTSGMAPAQTTGGGEPQTSTGDTDSGAIFDLGGQPDTPDVTPTCKVVDELDAIGECGASAPPNSFEPEVQWGWAGVGQEQHVLTMPLVANLTDDNGDGAIDLCDVPDVVVVVTAGGSDYLGHVAVLDGETGSLHAMFDLDVEARATPAIADLDEDGVPEILAQVYGSRELVAFDPTGAVLWTGDQAWIDSPRAAIAVANVDAAGAPEILVGNAIIDSTGSTLEVLSDDYAYVTQVGFGNATIAADLDGDDDLEVILGRSAFHHDGTEVYHHADIEVGFPQVANLDDDPEPEVLLTNRNGITLIEHDGTIAYAEQRPTGIDPGANPWHRPATIHDFDGDGEAELALSSQDLLVVYEADLSILWTAEVSDYTGASASTAFDFLGDGSAEAMYADESKFYVFDETGAPVLMTDRDSLTYMEYPVVADVDNDGSAEIVVVSNDPFSATPPPAAVQVIRDVEDRWIQARRIWNQHAYHVTNIREDATVPTVQPRSWASLNTFRTNAQIEDGILCQPRPAG